MWNKKYQSNYYYKSKCKSSQGIMQPNYPTNYTQKYVIIPSPKTLSEYDEYTLSKPDQQSLQFIKDKYLNANPKLKNNASPWQTKSKHDFRRQFVELFKQIAYKNTPPQTHQFTQLTDQTAILTLFQSYFELLIDHKFQQADKLIKKHNFTAFPQFLKRINAFSLKMIQYQSIVQENIKNKHFEQQLSFYWKVIQDMHDHKGLRDFMILNQKSPYMNLSLAAKLKKQWLLSQQNYEYLSICKGYERVILQLNNQLSKKPIVSFTQTNAQLSRFYCLDDFKCESTKQSGLKLKNNLRDLICNLTLSREKKVLNEPQKYLHAQQENQTWTYQLLNYFLAILSNNFSQSHFNSLHAYVTKKMHTNKSIRDKLDNLKGVVNRSLELVKFEKQIEELTLNIPQNIENTLSMIKPKQYNTDKMVKLFKRQLIYRLINQIHRDKTTDTNSTFIESMLLKYRNWIDQDNVKSIEKLVLKTGKQRKVLEDLMSSLQEIMNLIGLNQNPKQKLNPNTIQFYLQLFRKSKQIYAKLQGKKIPEDQSKTTTTLAKDPLPQNQIQLSQNNSQNNVFSQDIVLKEQNLQCQLEQCRKLKYKLLEVFSNFDREILSLPYTYTVRAGYEITRQSFQSYVNKKREKINKIMAQFDQTYQKGSNLTKISYKLKSLEQKQAEKFTVKIGLHQLNIFELKEEFLQLDAQLIYATEQFTKKQKQSQQQIEKLQSQLQHYKNEKSGKQKLSFQTGNRNHNLHEINYLNQTKQFQGKPGQFQVFGVPLQVDPFKMPNQKGHTQQNLNKWQYTNQYNDQISIENLHQKILQLQSEKNNINSIIQDKNEEILQLSTKNQKLLSQIQQLKAQLEQKKNETIKAQRSLKQTENTLKVTTQSNQKVVQSKNHKIEELQTKIIELNNKVSKLLQMETLYNDLKAKMTQMKMDSRKQKQANTKQLELISQFQKQIQRQNKKIVQLQLSKQSINKQPTESKNKKVLSQTYQIINLKIEIQKYKYRIKHLQEKTSLQQQEIKALKEQTQSKSNNVFKREEENDKKGPSRFKSLKEPDQYQRQSQRSISRQKQQLLNAINSKNSVDSGKMQSVMITRKDHELKIKQNTQNLKQQFEKEMTTKLQNIKLQFAKQKQVLQEFAKQKQSLQEKAFKQEKDLNVLTSRYQESNIAQQKHILRVDELQQQKLKLEQQTIQLKQQKQNVENQLSYLKQLVATQQEESKKKKQQEDDRFSMEQSQKTKVLKTQLGQVRNQVQQLKTQISQLQQNLSEQKSKKLQLQRSIQLSKSQKAEHMKEKEQEQITKKLQEEIVLLRQQNEKLKISVFQLETKLTNIKPKQDKPIIDKSKDELISEYDWKIFCLNNELKLKQQECDELGGFTSKKPKIKKGHVHTQTDNAGQEDQTKKQQASVKDKDVSKDQDSNESGNKQQLFRKNKEKVEQKGQKEEELKQKIEKLSSSDQPVIQEKPSSKEQRQFICQGNTQEQINPMSQKKMDPTEKQITQTNFISEQMPGQTQQSSLKQQDPTLNTENQGNVIIKSTIEQSQSINNSYKMQVKQYEESIDKITKENANLKQQVGQLQSQLQNLKVKSSQLDQQLIQNQNKLNESQSLHTELTKTHSTNSTQFQQFKIELQKKEAQLNQQIEKQKIKIQQLNEQSTAQKATIQQLNNQIATKQKQIQSSLDKISQLKIKNQQLSLKNQQLQTQNQQLFTQKQQLSTHNQQLSTQIQQLFTKNQQAENDLNLFKQEFVNKQLLLKQAQDKIALLQKQIQNYGPDMQNLRLQVKDYQYTIRQLRQKINNQLYPEIKQLKAKLKTLNEESRQLKKQSAEQIKRVKLQSSRQLNQLERQKSSLQFQIQNLKKNSGSKANTSSSSNPLVQMENQKLKKDLKKMQDQLNSCYSETTEHKKQIKQLQAQLKQKQLEVEDLYNNLNATNLTLKQVKMTAGSSSTPNPNSFQKPNSQYFIFDRLFPGQMLDEEHEKKYLLSNAIEKKMHKKISKTKLIYKYDPLNPTSFHNYVDGKENFLIIVRTMGGSVFGAFTTEKYQAKSKQSPFAESFIFSFNPESKEPISCFNLIKNMDKAKSLTYDEYFLIVGNSEIRWKMGEKSIYSNFGIMNSYFDPRGTNVQALLQLGEERETYMKGFECFQVCFEY